MTSQSEGSTLYRHDIERSLRTKKIFKKIFDKINSTSYTYINAAEGNYQKNSNIREKLQKIFDKIKLRWYYIRVATIKRH